MKRVLAALDGGPWQQELATALLTHIVSEVGRAPIPDCSSVSQYVSWVSLKLGSRSWALHCSPTSSQR